MKKLIELYKKLIPGYAHIMLILCLITDGIAYLLPRILKIEAVNDFSVALDKQIPLLPISSYIYILAFAYWAVNYIILARISKYMLKKVFIADTFAKIVCLICFLFIPSYIVQPEASEITGPGAWLLKIVYFVDEPNNLLPSIHCFVSWLCFRPMLDREAKDIPLGYKVFSFIFSMSICLSTLTTKQHVLWDVATGIGVAEAGWILAKCEEKRRIES